LKNILYLRTVRDGSLLRYKGAATAAASMKRTVGGNMVKADTARGKERCHFHPSF
jgi:hypothetical protein